MKKFFVSIFALLLVLSIQAQTATNFTCNDCNGNLHDLFTELDSGKVIVLCWVMPCGACISPAKQAYNTVLSYQSTNPDQVLFYMVDDYANTSCASLNSWANLYGFPAASFHYKFSNALINMMDYGSNGMPKTVVVAGPTHGVFYNMDNINNPALLERAIDSALATINNTGIESKASLQSQVFPNPATTFVDFKFISSQNHETKATFYNYSGRTVKEEFIHVKAGDNVFRFSINDLTPGIYMINVRTNEGLIYKKLLVQ